MRGYILRRLLQLVPTILLITFMVFALLHAMPGDPARALVGPGEALDEAQLASIRREYNLDKPILVQYGLWLGRALTGDLGRSAITQRRVGEELGLRALVTLELGIFAWLIASVIAVPTGIVAALNRGRPIDLAVTMAAVAAVALPGFWFGIMLILLFGVRLGWLPTQGYVALGDNPADALRHMLMPAFALGITSAALVMRQMRSAMVEVLSQDYVRTARAKGLGRRAVVLAHALRNALLPVVTVLGLQAAFLVGGLVPIETVFNIPGIARFLVEAVRWRDYPIVQNLVMLIAFVVITVNFLVDMAYMALDPRIKFAD